MYPRDRGGRISIIQEALKRAQDDYASKEKPQTAFEFVPKTGKSLSDKIFDKREMTKKIVIIASILALCVIVTGIAIRVVFSKMLMMDREKKYKIVITQKEKTDSDMTAPAAPTISAQPALEERPALTSSAQESQGQSFVLNGVMYVKGKPRAIINGTSAAEGDVINGATVTSISENKVSLKYINDDNKVEMVLRIKE